MFLLVWDCLGGGFSEDKIWLRPFLGIWLKILCFQDWICIPGSQMANDPGTRSDWKRTLFWEGPPAQNRGQTGSRYIVVMNFPTSGYDRRAFRDPEGIFVWSIKLVSLATCTIKSNQMYIGVFCSRSLRNLPIVTSGVLVGGCPSDHRYPSIFTS